MNKKVVGVCLLLSIIVLGKSIVSAQVASIMPISGSVSDVDPNGSSTCLTLTSENLRYRANDASANGEVTMLQDFLSAGSFLKSSATGFFGLGTVSAVKQFQKMSGLNPTGYVGVLTKAKIQERSCAGNPDAFLNGQGGSTVKLHETGGPGPLPATTTPMPVFVNCMMAAPPIGCHYIPGPMTTPGNNCNYILSCSDTKATSSDATEINPQNTFNPRPKPTPLPFPIATGTKGFACTMEMRLCPDGSGMLRTPGTCNWDVTSCYPPTPVPVETSPMVGPPVKAPPLTVTSTSSLRIPPLVPLTRSPVPDATMKKPTQTCTDVVVFCPDGNRMQRDTSCGWHPEMCSGAVRARAPQMPEGPQTSPVLQMY